MKILQMFGLKVKSDNAYLEISKYVAKDFEYLAHKEIFDVFYKSIKGKQLITYNKIFKDLAKQYDAGELDYLKEIDETKYVLRYFMNIFLIKNNMRNYGQKN